MTTLKKWSQQLADIAGADKKNIEPLADMSLQSQIDYLKQVHHVRGDAMPGKFDKRPIYMGWCDWCIRAHGIIEISRDENGKLLHMEELSLQEGFNRIEQFGKIAHQEVAGNVTELHSAN